MGTVAGESLKETATKAEHKDMPIEQAKASIKKAHKNPVASIHHDAPAAVKPKNKQAQPTSKLTARGYNQLLEDEVAEATNVHLPDASLDLSHASTDLSEMNRYQMNHRSDGTWQQSYLDNAGVLFAANADYEARTHDVIGSFTDEFKQMGRGLYAVASDPLSALHSLGDQMSQHLDTLSNPHAFLASMRNQGDAGMQNIAAAYDNIKHGRYGVLGEVAAAGVVSLAPVGKALSAAGKLMGAGKFGFFAKTGIIDKGKYIDLYRAVKPEELAQIIKESQFKNIPGMAEGKYFSKSLEEVKQYATMAEKAFGDEPYAFVKTTIPESHITEIMRANVDRGINAIVIPETHLQLLSTPEIIENQLIKRNIK